jgi:transcriptional regulator with XRE-family HTH domain
MKLHEKIKLYIESNGIKQVHVASNAGLPISKLNAILNGNRKMTADEFLDIATNGLRVDPSIFFADNVLETKKKSTA